MANSDGLYEDTYAELSDLSNEMLDLVAAEQLTMSDALGRIKDNHESSPHYKAWSRGVDEALNKLMEQDSSPSWFSFLRAVDKLAARITQKS